MERLLNYRQFIDEYAGSEFEIITEGYFGNTTTYTGWLWEKGKEPVSAILYIWNSGDLVYRSYHQTLSCIGLNENYRKFRN